MVELGIGLPEVIKKDFSLSVQMRIRDNEPLKNVIVGVFSYPNKIFLGTVEFLERDKIEFIEKYSNVEDIVAITITHETLHLVLEKITGSQASFSLDKLCFEATVKEDGQFCLLDKLGAVLENW